MTAATVKPRLRMTMRGGHLVPVQAQYEGGSHSRRMAGKGNVISGPNAPIARSLPTLQARSHNAIRNNAYARGAKEAYVSNLVGTGIKPQWGDPIIQALWDRWVEECDADGIDDFYGLQALAAGAQFEAGEALGRFRYRRTSDGLSVPLQVQVIEAEHLDPAYSRAFGGRLIKMGIEFNGIGQRTAFHLWRYHPHEKLTSELNTRVPVPADSVVHMFRRTRPGQLRGVPELTSVIVRLYEIDEMQDATLARQKLAQLFGAFVKRKTGHDPEDDGPNFGALVSQPGEVDPLSEFTPGGIHYLEDDEEITFSAPPDIGSNYTEWLRTELLAVARGAGITYEQLTGDLKGVNYSSIRAGLLEFRRRAEALQAQLIVHQWCRRIAAKWLDVAVTSGALPIANYWANRDALLAIDWIAPKWAWVDPLKEVTADLLEVRAGFKPRSEAAGERGWSLEQLDAEIENGNASAEQHGLVLDSDPRHTAKNGALHKALEGLANDPDNEEDDS
ncbi:phage portal protein, lambda family [Modicisalibacter muralis]|uniref:Phage portal protein, lambda family n=1 Tax=Modicisalibacter muralis TaxID=119000 RepID=A0A1G9MUK1_9GAMM|nr:phage portal protein [Halomonas muralis]SDL77909.1 phage portal protein, lambda family [Halomonas muralis]